MNSRKNKYFIKLITSYSLLLVIVLILGIVFHFILSHNAKQELLNENMLSLKNVSEQYSNCYANIYLISKRMANNSSLSRLAEADQGERAFYYNAYITKQALVDMRNGRRLWNPQTIITIFFLLTILRPNIHHTEKTIVMLSLCRIIPSKISMLTSFLS